MLRTRLPVPHFVSAGEVFAGPGSAVALRALNASRAVLFVGNSLSKDQTTIDQLKKSVGAHSLRVVVAESGEPSIASLKRALAEVSEFRPDWLIAVGGGSVIDGGKVIWALYEHPDVDLELITRPFALPKMRGRCRFAALPTTAGTGAEVSSAAVIIDPESGRKRFVVSHELLPDVAILDPRLTLGAPRGVMVSAALDALSHAVEGYVSVINNPLMDAFAHEAVATLLRELPRGIPGADELDRRLVLMQAAMLAGWVQNHRPPGIGHAVAHQMGRYSAPHGLSCGVLLPAAVRINLRHEPSRRRYQQLAERVGVGSVDGLLSALDGVLSALEVPSSLPKAWPQASGALNGDRKQIVADARADVCARTNPVPLEDDLVNELLDRVA